MKVSIITINFNNIDGLKRTINSISEQTYKDYELVVVDGGSRDGGKEYLEQVSGKFPHILWVSEPDKGIYNAMNKGTRMSSGEYCIFMNSGDCFFDSDSLKKSVNYLDGETDIISGAVKTDNFSKDAPFEKELSLSFFIKSSMNHQSTYIKRNLLIEYPYNEKRKIVADTEFFFQVLILKDASYKRLPFYVSYCESGGISDNVSKSMEERFVAIKELLPPRMSYDVDFISKYHNPILMSIGNILYRKTLRKIFFKYNQLKAKIKR